MHPQNSAACSAMPVPPLPYRTGYAGALDALANFWFKRIEIVDTGEQTTPEMNLEISAEAALAHCLKPHGLTNDQSCMEGMFEDGFGMGLRVAAVLAQQPFEAEKPLRRLLDELVAVIHERRREITPPRNASSLTRNEEN
jgi:hypothetical protein